MSKLNGSDIIIQDIGFSYLVRYLGSAFEIIKQPYPVELLKTQNDKKKVLIYSIHHLQKVINHYEMVNPYFYQDNKRYLLESYYGTFITDKINTIYDEDYQNSLMEILFSEYQKSQLKQMLNSLSLNVNLYIKPYNRINDYNFSIIESYERNQLVKLLRNCYESTFQHILAITGPYSIGKTVSLLYYSSSFYPLVSSVYINIKYLYNNLNNAQKIIEEEMVKLYPNKETYQKNINLFQSLIMNSKTPITDIWSYIFHLITVLRSDEQKHMLIIDKYKQKYDQFYKNINEIKITTNTLIKIVVCSSINHADIRNNIIQGYALDYSIREPVLSYHYIPKLIEMKLTEEDMANKDFMYGISHFNGLTRYYYELKEKSSRKEIESFIDGEKKNIKNKIEEFYIDIKENCVFSLLEIKQCLYKEISKTKFICLIHKIPLKYFVFYYLNKLEDNNENNLKKIIDEKNEEYYIIKPHFPLINEIIDDIIFDSISDTKHLNQLINELVNYNSIFKGLFFEETIHYMFQKKRKPFNNITIDNTYFVKDLILFEESTVKQNSLTTFENQTIYIRPTNMNASYFDSAIIDLKNKDYPTIIIFQTTIKKESRKMMGRNFIDDVIKEIKKGNNFNKIVGYYKELQIYMFYIIADNENNDETINFCKTENIPFVYFSIKDLCFSLTKSQTVNEIISLPLNEYTNFYSNSFFDIQTTSLEPINNFKRHFEDQCYLLLGEKRKRNDKDNDNQLNNLTKKEIEIIFNFFKRDQNEYHLEECFPIQKGPFFLLNYDQLLGVIKTKNAQRYIINFKEHELREILNLNNGEVINNISVLMDIWYKLSYKCEYESVELYQFKQNNQKLTSIHKKIEKSNKKSQKKENE